MPGKCASCSAPRVAPRWPKSRVHRVRRRLMNKIAQQPPSFSAGDKSLDCYLVTQAGNLLYPSLNIHKRRTLCYNSGITNSRTGRLWKLRMHKGEKCVSNALPVELNSLL